MQIDNEFTVGVPIEQAWAVLTDLPGIAPCMPGAQLTGVEDDVYSGKVKVKVGPVTSEYAGTAKFAEKDDATYHAVIDARGRDSRGAGNASALITAQLRPDGDRTVVSVSTDLKISGRIAQFGSGMIKEVSAKLLGQFVECLEGKLSATIAAEPAAEVPAGVGSGGAAAATAAGPETSAETAAPPSASSPAPSASSPAAPGAAAEAGSPAPAAPAEAPVLDLMSVAGGSIYKRLLPLIVVLVVVAAAAVYFLVR